MARLLFRSAFSIALPFFFCLAGCSDVAESDEPTGGDEVTFQLLDPSAGSGLGGAGGSSDTSEPLVACFPEIVSDEEGLPECFVAEVSEASLDCSAVGRAELSESRQSAVRDTECFERQLETEPCAALSICEVLRLPSDVSCDAGVDDAAGFCQTESRHSSCGSAYEDSIRVLSPAAAPIPAAADGTLMVFCAVLN